MAFEDLSTTNVWLALIAISSVVQLLMVVGLLVGAYRFSRRVEATIDRIQHEHIAPVSARAHKVLDQVEHVVARVRAIDDGVRRTLATVGDGVGQATAAVRTRLWPLVGLARGLKAGLSTLAERRPDSLPREQRRPDFTPREQPGRDDTEAERRFAYEGGISHARS